MQRPILSFALLLLTAPAMAQTLQWAIPFNNLADFQPMHLTHAHGRLAMMGHYAGSIDLDPGPDTLTIASAPQYAHFLATYDTSGALKWGQSIPSAPYTLNQALAIATDRAVYAAMPYGDSWDADPGPGTTILPHTQGDIPMALLKYDSAGQYQWAVHLTGHVRFTGLRATPGGGVLVFGHYQGTPDFDPGPATLQGQAGNARFEPFLWRLNPDGSLHSLATFQGPGSGNILAATYTTTGDMALFGVHDSIIDLDPRASSLPSTTAKGLFMMTLDSSLTPHILLDLPTDTGSLYPLASFDPSGNLILSARLSMRLDLDPGPDTAWAGQDLTSTGVVLSYNAAGHLRWHHTLPLDAAYYANALQAAPSGEFALGGTTAGTFDADPGPAQYPITGDPGGNPFFIHYDSSGQVMDARSFSAALTYRETLDGLCFAGNRLFTAGSYNGPGFQMDGQAMPWLLGAEGYLAAFGPQPLRTPHPVQTLPDMLAWPQPLGGTLHIEVPGQHKALPATLHDLQGRPILHTTLQPGTNHLDLSRLSAGMYILSTPAGHKMRVLKE